jgi:hypothetical protein
MNIILNKLADLVNWFIKPVIILPPVSILDQETLDKQESKPKVKRKSKKKNQTKKKKLIVIPEENVKMSISGDAVESQKEDFVIDSSLGAPVVPSPAMEQTVGEYLKLREKLLEEGVFEPVDVPVVVEPVVEPAAPAYIEGEIEVGDIVIMKPSLQHKLYYIEGQHLVLHHDKSTEVITLKSHNITTELKLHSSQFLIVRKKDM